MLPCPQLEFINYLNLLIVFLLIFLKLIFCNHVNKVNHDMCVLNVLLSDATSAR